MDDVKRAPLEIPRNWTFERPEIAHDFERHVREQLPWYDLATNAVAHVARHYIPRHGRIYDIGASTGNMDRALAATISDRCAKFIPVEVSAVMASQYDGPSKANLQVADAMEMKFEEFDVAILFLVLMFMPVARRREFFDRLRARMRPGGAIIVFDKVPAARGYAATVLWRLALAGKIAAGVEPREVIDKELSLGGVQRPIDPSILGPEAVEWFRFGDFVGWIVEKPETP